MDDIGLGGVDDDNDGTTDEPGDAEVDEDESPGLWPTTAGGGFGNSDGTGFEAGVDRAPGVAGTDDDGNGTTDDVGETGWPGSDDGDDTNGLSEWMMWMRMNFNPDSGFISKGIFVAFNPGADPQAHFNMGVNGAGRPFPLFESTSLETSNEIPEGFYRPNTMYGWQFCGSGTCYGAALWVPGNIANPDETLGPILSSFTTTFLTSNIVASGNGVTRFSTGIVPRNVFIRRNVWRVNPGFSHKFWVIEGDLQTNYPSPSTDLDGDRDVDGTDFLTFSNCFNGSLNPPNIGPGCTETNARDADADLDGDVDGEDFLVFSNCFNGALKRPNCIPVDPTTCPGGGGEAMGGGGGSLLAQSAVQSDPFLFDGMTPNAEVWYLYTPGCTGQATLALCDATGQGRSVDGIFFAFFDGTAEESIVVPATACGETASQTVPVVAGQTVLLLVFREPGAESLDGFTLSVPCE